MRVVLTYSLGRLLGLAEALYEEGYEVEHTPLIETRPLQDLQVKAQAKALLECPWMVFSSQATLEAWQSLDLPLPGKEQKLAAVGKKTAEKLTELGLRVNLIAEPQNALGLVNCFTAHPEACGPIALPQGNRALATVQQKLEHMGYETLPLSIYETVTLEWLAGVADVIVVASPSAVEVVPDRIAAGAQFISLGETTQTAVRTKGWRGQVADSPAIDDVLDAIERLVPA